jgi:hypothetical protein
MCHEDTAHCPVCRRVTVMVSSESDTYGVRKYRLWYQRITIIVLEGHSAKIQPTTLCVTRVLHECYQISTRVLLCVMKVLQGFSQVVTGTSPEHHKVITRGMQLCQSGVTLVLQ